MTMKAKLAGTIGLPFEVREVSCYTYEEFTGKEAIPFIQYYADEEGNFYKDTDLDFNLNPPQLEATISGWVARDSERASNSLNFHRNEVVRGKFYWENKEANRPIGETLILPNDMFSTLTWQDEPIEVEITIKPKKNET